jgi:hypothetical protein
VFFLAYINLLNRFIENNVKKPVSPSNARKQGVKEIAENSGRSPRFSIKARPPSGENNEIDHP